MDEGSGQTLRWTRRPRLDCGERAGVDGMDLGDSVGGGESFGGASPLDWDIEGCDEAFVIRSQRDVPLIVSERRRGLQVGNVVSKQK